MTKKWNRFLALALCLALLCAALPSAAAATRSAEDSFGWYGWVDGEWVWIEADVGIAPGQWRSVPLTLDNGTELGRVWYKSAPANAQEDSPDRVDIRFNVYDSYQDVPSAADNDDDAYCIVTLPTQVCSLYESEDGDDYGVKNFAVVFSDGYCFSNYLSYYANAYNSYEQYVSSHGSDYFAQAYFDDENYQLTWDSLRDNQAGYVQLTANIQTQDPAHEKLLVDNDLVRLTVTGYHNTTDATVTLPLSDYAEVDKGRELRVTVLEGEDADFDPEAVTVTADGSTVTAAFGSYVLKDGVTYALEVPIAPSQAGLDLALASASPWLSLPVNVDNGATLRFTYDMVSEPGYHKTAEYYEEPNMDVARTDAGTVRVQYRWADGAAHSGDTVTVELLHNGSAVSRAVLDSSNDFSGEFAVSGAEGTLTVRAAQVTVGGADVTDRYAFTQTVTAAEGRWTPVSVSDVENAKAENRLYAVSYGYNGADYLFTNEGTTMTAVQLSSAPVTISGDSFTTADLGAAVGSDGLASWNHMQWMVLADNAFSNCIRLYNLATERYLSMDSLLSSYTFSMSRSADGVSVKLVTDSGAAAGRAFLKMYVNNSTTNWSYFKAQTLPVPSSAGTGGYAASTKLAADAAQFRFWSYAPDCVNWTITGTGEDSAAPFRFDDVQNENAYYYAPVYWALERGITAGATETSFLPNAACTRAQIVTFLWRMAGSPSASAEAAMPFVDVKENAWYFEAVRWAAEAGVTTGTSATRFSPNEACTRAQIAVFLWRMAGSPAPEEGAALPFTDVPDGAWYRDALLWARGKGIVAGVSATAFLPASPCTRGQTVTMLLRFDQQQ